MRVQLTRGEDGAVAVTVAILTVVLLIMAGFALDFGMAFAQRRALSTGADSGALAIVEQKYQQLTTGAPGLTCADLLTDPAAADALALEQVNANKPFGQTLTDAQVTTTLECVGAGTLKVTVRVDKAVDTTLGRLAGVESIAINRTAAAAVGVQDVRTGYFPLGICTDVAQQIVANARADELAGHLKAGFPYRHEVINVEKLWKGANACITPKTGSGNWGWLKCGSGESDLKKAVEAGACSDKISFDAGTPPTATILSKPGGADPTSSMDKLLPKDKVVAFPVYESISKTGRADYRVLGFLSARICAYEPSLPTTGPCYGTKDSWLDPPPTWASRRTRRTGTISRSSS